MIYKIRIQTRHIILRNQLNGRFARLMASTKNVICIHSLMTYLQTIFKALALSAVLQQLIVT